MRGVTDLGVRAAMVAALCAIIARLRAGVECASGSGDGDCGDSSLRQLDR